MNTTQVLSVSSDFENAVFDAAISLEDEKERDLLLQLVFRGNPEALARLRRMIGRRGEASAFFLEACEQNSVLAGEILNADPTQASIQAPSEAGIEEPGSRIGSYLLVSRIGEGGYGVVYEAEQESPVRRSVALKILRAGMDTESVIARFAAERQALALMDHPNIAHVYDAGATAAGRPYFVMERVVGERITVFCDREQLTVAARLELFIQICHAIQHAHQKGVIHRDIKPSNILVTLQDDMPTPKVIDFGIAKATGLGGTPLETPQTMVDQIVGTPPYMSPEQVDMSGIDVDTRSDVYSLGALLHELLGGRPPFDESRLAKAGISEMRRILLEEEPPLLSRMLASLPPEELARVAAARATEPARLIAGVRGDLDWIAATAMARDRTRRYQTVNALAADLRRFLANEPVTASKPGRLYLAGKFIRRNRVACVSGAAVMLSLLAGLGAATSMYLKERKALAEQERLSQETEVARSREAWLRQQAQARANVSQAAVLLADGRSEEADALLRESPLESIEPSREAAGVFRALGERNALRGRWKQALQSFILLDQANRLDDPARIVEKVDLLMIAPMLLAHGAPGAYEDFRRDTLENYLPARNAGQAEHLLKVCLLTPADDTTLGRLKNAAELCARPESSNPGLVDWNALAMTLYHHRLGDPKKTLEWAKTCLSYRDSTGPRTAATLALAAMARYRAGDRKGAVKDLDKARDWIARKTPLDPNLSLFEQGSWYSWLTAGILVEEAEREMKVESGSGAPPSGGH